MNSNKDKQQKETTKQKKATWLPELPTLWNMSGNKNSTKSIGFLFLVAIIISLFLFYTKNVQKYEDKNIPLNVLEQNFKAWQYSAILIDKNKAIATLTGQIDATGSTLKIKRDIVILPKNDSLNDLGLKNPEIQTKISIKYNSSD